MEEKGKKLGLWNIIGLGLGGAIGTGVFVLLGYGVAYTGRSISLVVTIGCFFMLLAYWYNLIMPSMFVLKGGDYSMKAMLFNPFMSGVSAWMILVNGLAMSSYAVALAQYLAIAVPALQNHQTLVAFIAITLFFLSTIKGSRFITILENIITLVLVASLALFIIFGIPKVDFASTFTSADGGFFHGGFTGFVSALAVMGFACQGTTMAPVSMAAVTKNPKRTIPLGIIIITLLLAVIYGAMGIVAGGVLPYAETAGQNISVTARAIFPNALYVFFVVGGGFFHGGFTGFVSALAVMGFACQGTTMAPVSMAAVTKNPKRTIPLGIIIITLLLAVIYGAMGIVAGGVLPYAETAGQNISVTARAIFPNALYVFFVVGGGIGAIASSALGGLGMFRYPLLQVANDGWLPSVFKKTDKNGYPYAIYLLFYVISVFPIVTGRSLDAIVSQVMIPAMLINIYMNLACLTLPKKYPEQWAQRSIKMPLWFYNICCVLGAFCAGVVAYNLFKDLTFNDAVFAVVIVVVLCALSILRLKQGAVKAEDLAAKKEEIVRQAIADTTADEAKAA